LPNVLVYPNTSEEDKKARKEESKKRNKNTISTALKSPELEEWSCYGTTEVDLLVLRHVTSGKTKEDEPLEETIAAVAPYTAPGMQVRDITSSTLGKERTRTIRLGILEIVYSTAMDAAEQEESEMSSQHRRRGKKQQDHKEEQGSNTGSRVEEKEDADASSPLSTPARVYQAAQTIAKHMEINAKLLYESTQDNFPERTYEAGQRIYEELPHTLNRTIEMMKKMANFFGGDGDNDDSKSDSHSGSGSPRKR
jgi:hypothetical protein